MTEPKYPNCRCERVFGIDMICGDPDCDQVKDVNKKMSELCAKLAETFGGDNGLGDTTFNLPDFRRSR